MAARSEIGEKTETLGTRKSEEEACDGPMEVSTYREGLCATC